MDFHNLIVNHKIFGEGKITALEGNKIIVEFSKSTKSFAFPDAFENHLKCIDSIVQSKIKKLIVDKKASIEQLRKQQVEGLNNTAIKEKTIKSKTTKNNLIKYPENIAFKCNYCNGGIEKNGVGFCGVCSDEMIRYNIEVKKHSWCSCQESPCFQYLYSNKLRNELDNECGQGFFVCYESQMLENWNAYAGSDLSNNNKRKIRQISKNSLAILTTREKDCSEKKNNICCFPR